MPTDEEKEQLKLAVEEDQALRYLQKLSKSIFSRRDARALARILLLQQEAIVHLLEREKRLGYYESDDDQSIESFRKAYGRPIGRLDGFWR